MECSTERILRLFIARELEDDMKMKLTLIVDYDESTISDKDAEMCLNYLVGYAAGNGMLSTDEREVRSWTHTVECVEDRKSVV